jgi:hypothetical protein
MWAGLVALAWLPDRFATGAAATRASSDLAVWEGQIARLLSGVLSSLVGGSCG